MNDKTAGPISLNRPGQPITTPPALNKLARVGAIPNLLKKRDKTSTSGGLLQPAVKSDAKHSALKTDEQKADAKPVSLQKVAANRRNAQRSSGPRTERGKNHSRWNAQRDGILSKALLILKGPGAEDVAAYYKSLGRLYRDC